MITKALTWEYSCVNKPNGNYRNPENCSKFFMCSNHLTYSMNCVTGLHYDAEFDQCVWPYQANCRIDLCEGKPNGNYKDPQNCDKFISCVWGVTYSMNCYYGLYYNADTDECVYPHETNCH